MWTWLTSRLVPEARDWWRLWSVRLGALASLLFSYLLAYPDILIRTLNELPPEIRQAFPPAAGLGLFVLVTLVRLYNQKKPDA